MTGKGFHLVYAFSKISFSERSPSSLEVVPWAPVVKALLHAPPCAAPLRHSPEATWRDRAHLSGDPESGYSEQSDRWKQVHRSNGSVHVWWEINCQRYGGIPFVSKVLLQRNRLPQLSLRKALCGRLCRPSYNAVTEKPVFNWSLTESAQSR